VVLGGWGKRNELGIFLKISFFIYKSFKRAIFTLSVFDFSKIGKNATLTDFLTNI